MHNKAHITSVSQYIPKNSGIDILSPAVISQEPNQENTLPPLNWNF